MRGYFLATHGELGGLSRVVKLEVGAKLTSEIETPSRTPISHASGMRIPAHPRRPVARLPPSSLRYRCHTTPPWRTYTILGIETSCDDTSVCVLDRYSPTAPPNIVFSRRTSTDNAQFGGIIPTVALEHHQRSLAVTVASALSFLRDEYTGKPDLIAVTRGPGLRASLAAGTELAKGLSLAFQVPLIGVHHMLGHLLVSRMLAPPAAAPHFPFLSLLVSGGHTMLVRSISLTQHEIIANTVDIAVGDAVDKCARALGLSAATMLGPELEKLAQRADAINTSTVVDPGISISVPMRPKPGRPQAAAFSFSSYVTMVERGIKARTTTLNQDELALVARQTENAIFTQIVERVQFAIKSHRLPPMDFVCSGGVASNARLRETLETAFPQHKLYFPPPKLCTDNAEMIAWAGIELWESLGLHTSLDFLPTATWPLEGFLDNIDCWLREEQADRAFA
ncbi:glycoprotease family-domain-containing protein [Limtongia smithiae]|uniref:glycoprotease family-domain-containing protein n=1 Tax=Limtongia smithiae TaxID=1125753 RepID=UPI0034CE6858